MIRQQHGARDSPLVQNVQTACVVHLVTYSGAIRRVHPWG